MKCYAQWVTTWAYYLPWEVLGMGCVAASLSMSETYSCHGKSTVIMASLSVFFTGILSTSSTIICHITHIVWGRQNSEHMEGLQSE